MAKTQTIEEIDTRTYNSFWGKMQQFKHDLHYLNIMNNHYVFLSRMLKLIPFAGTFIATSVWMSWHDNDIVAIICPIIIFLMQAITAIAEKLPYDDRKTELRELMDELRPLYAEMENDWRNYSSFEISNKEMREKIETIYMTMSGQLKEEYCFPGVENAFARGAFCMDEYSRMLAAYQRLCKRLGTEDEDADVEVIIHSLMNIEKELCFRMYYYGAKFGLEA